MCDGRLTDGLIRYLPFLSFSLLNCLTAQLFSLFHCQFSQYFVSICAHVLGGHPPVTFLELQKVLLQITWICYRFFYLLTHFSKCSLIDIVIDHFQGLFCFCFCLYF